MTSQNKITLVVVSDDHYMILVAALIKSVEKNLSANSSIDLWIIEDNVTDRSKNMMETSADNSITTIHWKPLKDIIPPGISLPSDLSSYPLNIYMRLFIPYFIPEGVDKVIYLDADMIVKKDLTELWATDITPYTIGAVMDPRLKTFDNSWGGIRNYKKLGFAGSTPYFNTGLLLINIPKWRANNITEKIVEVINDNKRYANYPDQYGMNIVLADQWLHLDDRWNHFVTIPHPDPFIIHYVERKPIYSTYKNGLEYKQLFYHYLEMTAWKGAEPIGESQRYVKKLKNIIDKFKK